MWSVSGSALVPNAVTTVPLTFTWPALISSSALRREAIPAAAIIFCRRSVGMAASNLACDQGRLFFLRGFGNLFRGGIGLNRGFGFTFGMIGIIRRRVFGRHQLSLERFRYQLFELFHAGKFVHVLQAKAHQELFGGLVKNRTSDHLLAAGGGDQLPIKQGGNHA